MKDETAIVLNSLLYILHKFDNHVTGIHKLCKILYFAEQKHLAKFGKPITEDDYVAMKFGPVPSTALDLYKFSKRKEQFQDFFPSTYFNVNRYNISSVEDPDLEWLSKTEIQCIDEAFEENKDLSFEELTDKSHDSAWHNAYDHSVHYMDRIEIAEAGGANEPMIHYLSNKEEAKKVKFI